MNWWIIIGLVLLVMFLFKYKEMKHRIWFLAIFLLLLFLVGSFGQLYTRNNFNLTSFEGITSAGKAYFVWMGVAFGNIAKIGGYAVKQEWDINSTAEVIKKEIKDKVK
jgi:formate hydrogenlyase subunit 3/multisubunit Na+/H+ antiporter MnhD subunit